MQRLISPPSSVGRVAVTLALAMLGAGPGCGDNLDPSLSPPSPSPPDEIALAATFEVDADGALIWLYAERSAAATVRVEDELGVQVAELPSVALSPERGRTGVAVLSGLDSDSVYRYTVTFSRGGALGPFYLHTAPRPEDDADVHFVYSADIDVSAEFESDIFASMSARGASFFVSLGDWPYGDNYPASYTVAEFRARHREVRVPARIQGMLRALPVYATWDDHEARNNWDGGHRVTEPERIAAAEAVWDEWFPLQARLAGDEQRWRSVRWGRHLELFILDTRCCRSANLDPDGPDKTLLGAAQRQWLIDALPASEATFKLIVTSVPMATPYGVDGWASFATERDLVLAGLAARRPSGVLALTGDHHRFAAWVLPEWNLREFMAGPLARHPSPPAPEGPTLLAQAMGYSFGEVQITAEGRDGAPTLTFTARDDRGEELYRETFRAEELVLTGP
ncbi:alkaline phosphatase D family protein [Haliangium sp.]|uniref:alkaline phosphatase D family protein n=1 Tax=Haliangium sp. TaxID=2663208 RepID=UPI003D0ACF9D